MHPFQFVAFFDLERIIHSQRRRSIKVMSKWTIINL
jgi:hypothetical protein